MPISFLLAGAGTIDFGAALGDQGLTALGTGRRGWLSFSGALDAAFPWRARLAGFTGPHPAIVRDKGAPARAGHDPILRDLLGVPGPTPGIDRSAGGVEAAAVTDDQGLPRVFYLASDQGIHGTALWGGREVNGSLKAQSIRINPIILKTAPAPAPRLFMQKYMMTCYVLL